MNVEPGELFGFGLGVYEEKAVSNLAQAWLKISDNFDKHYDSQTVQTC